MKKKDTLFSGTQQDKEIYLHFNAAPLGFLSIAAHGHADALSFILHINGVPFFVDSGTYTYHTEYRWRKYFMGTLAHNTIRVNRKDQAQIAGPTLWLNHYKTTVITSNQSKNIDRVEAMHNGYKKEGIIHIREIVLNKTEEIIEIIDTVKCENRGNYFIELPFHLHPEIKILEHSKIEFILSDQQENQITLHADNKLKTQIIKGQQEPQILGWYSKSFMKKEPCTTIYCSTNISNTQIFHSLIYLK